MIKKQKCLITLLVMLSNLVFVTAIQSVGYVEKNTIPIASWLTIGPLPVRMPVFHDVESIKGKTFRMKELLRFDHADIQDWRPDEGDHMIWDGSLSLRWNSVLCDTHGVMLESGPDASIPEITYLAAYIDVRRFTKAKLQVSGFHLFCAYVDGDMILEKTKSEKPKDEASEVKARKVSKEVSLETGVHLLLIKALRDPECEAAWMVKAKLSTLDDWNEDDITVRVSPRQVMTIGHMLDGPKVSSVSISPDGELVAVSMSESLPPSDDSESWVEIRQTKDGSLYQTYRGGMKLSGIQWSPKGRRFSYISSDKTGKTLWITDLEKGTSTPLLKNIEGLDSHAWAPDGSFIVYGITEKPDENKTGLKKLEGMPDRWPGYRDRSFLYRVNVSDGTRTRLTAGKLSTRLNGISPDGTKLLFTRSQPDFSERPFDKTEFFLLDLNAMTLDTLFTDPWIEDAQWSPDGKKLLITGCPAAFDGIGEDVPEGVISNAYDTQAIIYYLATGKIDPITKDFDPAVAQAVWSKSEDCIYFNGIDRTYRRLFRYDPKQKTYKMIDTGVDVMGRFDIAENHPTLVYTGSGVSQPPKAYLLDLRRKRSRLLVDPGEKDYEHVVFGRSERWSFTNARGVEIEGRIYYPLDFDPNRKYPCIVYYYGGTTPVNRSFGGRYPKEIWVANGYVVYVLQPSGAIGYGQAFSALHVNDWGKIVADEIIDGTKEFVAVHPFVDEQRVGCIGASFGGFMTMLLMTRTDMFCAAVAHAGISSISSYWGEGFWGYLYGTRAMAGSFPWNRKDIYVDQSPLFYADKITTPLLLLHGASDTNVPPGESRQLYAALKLLGREVELIEVEGQNHLILEYNKRIRWSKSILAWFDRWLKDQPQWWEDLYPEQ